MKNFLLVDFGASRIKSGIFNTESGVLSDIQSYASLPPAVQAGTRFEVSAEALKKKFIEIIKAYADTCEIEGVAICSEMHGFLLTDPDNKPLTNYISWKDERSLDEIDGKTSFAFVTENLGKPYRDITLFTAKPCYPAFNLMALARKEKIKQQSKIISLPEWLACCSGKSGNNVHETMFAALGFYDFCSKKPSGEYLDLYRKITGTDLIFNQTTEEITVSGFAVINGRDIPVYSGVGDHQCAVLGAGNKPLKTISINLGTGSQMSKITDDISNKEVDYRPFFDGYALKTVTHIPSGRALNVYIGLLASINPHSDYWETLKSISTEEIESAQLEFDLSIFSSAWNYSGGGKISKITETGFNVRHYLASLLKSYIKQYLQLLPQFESGDEHIILSGGIPSKLPAIREIISEKSGKTVIIHNEDIEETFSGLKILMQKIAVQS